MNVKALLCLASLALCACSEAVQSPALHDFGAFSALPAPSRPLPAAAEINVVAPQWLADDRIRYRLLYDRPSRVRFYNLDRWLAPPPELLKLHLAAVRFEPRYAVTVRLLNYEQQFDAPGSATVVLNFVAEAFATGSKNKLGVQEFALRSGKVRADAQGAVEGSADLAVQAGASIQRWLQGLK